jgi:hypothetical protein
LSDHLLIFGCRFESLRLWSCDKLGPLLMVGLLALSCALLIWASREPAKKWAPADAWRDNDEQVVIDTARVVVRVTAVLSGQIVVQDLHRRTWLLIVEENAAERKFSRGEALGVEITRYRNRPPLFLAVPKMGYHWVVPLRSITPWSGSEEI